MALKAEVQSAAQKQKLWGFNMGHSALGLCSLRFADSDFDMATFERASVTLRIRYRLCLCFLLLIMRGVWEGFMRVGVGLELG